MKTATKTPKKATITPIKTDRNPLANLGARIAKIREDARLTQTDLAKKIDTTQSVIARIEKGEQNLSAETLSKISEALNHPIVEFAREGTLNFRIHGGRKLSGSIKVRTSKNGTVGVMAASLLNKGTTTIKNAPRIEEVYRIAEGLESIGVKVEWKGDDLVITPPKKIQIDKLSPEATMQLTKTRSVIMFMGPFIHEFRSFNLPQAGGCRLGTRTVKPYHYALERLGVNVVTKSDHYEVTHNGLKQNAEVIMYESGDTATETILMAAARIPGTTTIKFASPNYMVQDVCHYLEKLGVKIEGIGSATLIVHGKADINTNIEYTVTEDPIESMSLLAAAIVTKSQITIERVPIDFLELELFKLEKMGFKYKILKRYKAANGVSNLADLETYPSELAALEEKIHAMHPGINMDNLPFFAVIGTQAEGTTFIHDWSFEERAIYFTELNKLRAETLLADPHRFYVKGPTKLKAAELVCPPALRPAVILLIAMLAAEGTSILRNVYNINRGYEDLAARLNSIGAKIETFRDL
jgi:UDP-N-acetylglucosamine 1-carboxyvinyltransferase